MHAQCNLDTLHGVKLALQAVQGPWCVGGDWNCTPEELEATGWLKLVGGVVKAPRTPTCNGRIIDFFVVSSSLDHAARTVRTVSDARLHPHTPVRLFLKANSRTCMVRQIVKPLGWGATLPFGPLDHPARIGLVEAVEACSCDDQCVDCCALNRNNKTVNTPLKMKTRAN